MLLQLQGYLMSSLIKFRWKEDGHDNCLDGRTKMTCMFKVPFTFELNTSYT